MHWQLDSYQENGRLEQNRRQIELNEFYQMVFMLSFINTGLNTFQMSRFELLTDHKCVGLLFQ